MPRAFGYRRRSSTLVTVLLVAYVIGLARHGDGFSPLVDGWLGILTQAVPAALCLGAARRAGWRRPEVLLAAAGVTCFAAANLYYVLAVVGHLALPYPSPADVGYLAFYPFVLAALAVTVRRNLHGTVSALWLDSLLGALGAATVLAVLMNPVFDAALSGGVSLAAVVAAAYPLFDLLLIAAIVGIAALNGRRADRGWILLSVGLLVFAVSDVIYALRVAKNAYAIGTPLDAGWAIGLSLVALGVVRSSRSSAPAPAAPVTQGLLAVPAVATAAALGVLLIGTQHSLPKLAVVLAGVTVLAAAARTQLAFRQLVRMAVLRRQATTDDLTGLPNRRALYAALPTDATGQGTGNRALLLLDLDRFKEVNDSLGHHVGDRLLVEVGSRLSGQLRSGDLLARLGGDEFALLLADADQNAARAVAEKVRAALAQPFELEGIALHTGVSIGIALYPQHGLEISALLRKADMAMYRAKATHGGHQVYSGNDEEGGRARLHLLQELDTALMDNQLTLHYQPKIDLQTGAICGAEALVRWAHPERGLLYPDAFLDVVEEGGFMRRMTRVVLIQALDQAAAWHRDGLQLTIAVNLSTSSLMDAHLPEEVFALLADRGLPARTLQMEITEELLMADRDRAGAILARLRHHGIQISVDDFGTGYSSLAYLRDLPVDELKLDRSFIAPMADDTRAAALVASTIDLAHSLGLRMVAEGVENPLAYADLRRLGCDQAQGYHILRPVPASELASWIRSNSREWALQDGRTVC